MQNTRAGKALICALIVNSQTIAANPHTSYSGFRSKESAAVAYTVENKLMIEGAIMGDCLMIKKKDGTVETLNVNGLNRAAKDKSRYIWNLFVFYIVKDAWRGLIHQNAVESKYGSEKLFGQANITLVINADSSHQIAHKVIYVAGCAPSTGEKMTPPVQKFWRQVQGAIDSIEFKQMKIPDPNVGSVTLELIIGRDLERFPRYPAGTLKANPLLRDKDGTITQAKECAK